jgi:hypothetical protein
MHWISRLRRKTAPMDDFAFFAAAKKVLDFFPFL